MFDLDRLPLYAWGEARGEEVAEKGIFGIPNKEILVHV